MKELTLESEIMLPVVSRISNLAQLGLLIPPGIWFGPGIMKYTNVTWTSAVRVLI